MKPVTILLVILTLAASTLSMVSTDVRESLPEEQGQHLDSGGRYISDYYSSAAGLTGNDLHEELYAIIRNHSASTYDQVWEHLRTTDESPSDEEEVILYYTRRSHSENGTCGDGNACTSQSWNREHLWPKSHGGFDTNRYEAAGTDLHAIRPADNTVNTDRNDRDFDDVSTPNSECTGCNSSSDAWEPPSEVKGDTARALFYMDVRYNGYGSEPNLMLVNHYTETTEGDGYLGKLCILFQWHVNDPVDDAESSRNELVHSIQANRNPFIDRPRFVSDIWGSDCDFDLDQDGLMNSEDADDDGDGVDDVDDVNPLDGCVSIDTDGDGLADSLHPSGPDAVGCDADAYVLDSDDDGDGYADLIDAFPLDGSEWSDIDGDGIGDNADSDADGDLVPDGEDAFPLDPSESSDADQDGVGDNSDSCPDTAGGDAVDEWGCMSEPEEYAVVEDSYSDRTTDVLIGAAIIFLITTTSLLLVRSKRL